MATATTIHFKANFKNKEGRGVVPHCSRFALSPRYGTTTEDKSKVNCTRCAKQLDITPVAKVVSSTIGTCQCCFGGYETRQKGGEGAFRSVLHGYKRPGVGYIIGDCQGCGFAPFEVSCEQTKVFLAAVKGCLVATEDYLDRLVTDKVEVLCTEVATGNRIPHPKYGGSYTTSEYKEMEVKLGDAESQNPFQMDKPWERVPSYDTLRARKVRDVEAQIRQIQGDIAFLTGKIEGWVAVPFPISK